MREKKVVISIIAVCVLLLIGCKQPGGKWEGTIEEDHDGYRVVKRYNVNWNNNYQKDGVK